MSESTETPKKKPARTSRAKAAGAAEKPAGGGKANSTPKNAATVSALPTGEAVKITAPPAGEKSAAAGKSAKARAQIANAEAVDSTAKPARRASGQKAKGDGKGTSAGQLPDQETIDKMVAEAAYYLAEKRNFAVGFEEQDWLAAKEQIMTQLLGAKKPKG